MSDDLTVVRNEEKNRFEIDLGDGLAMVEYMTRRYGYSEGSHPDGLYPMSA